MTTVTRTVTAIAADSRTAPQELGHGPAGLGALDPAVLLRASAVRCVAAPAAVSAGRMAWPIQRGLEVMAAWRDRLADASGAFVTAARFLRFPADPGVPVALQGEALVAVDVAGDRAAAEPFLAGLRRLEPVLETWAATGVHPEPPLPDSALTVSARLSAAPDALLAAFDAVAGASAASPVAVLELRRVDGGFAMRAAGLPAGRETTAVLELDLAALRAASRPYEVGGRALPAWRG
jgi:hypothetical protein